ncbi:MAG TPA: RecQ family ATP-dependent DNA helicase [Terriglobia bacterium]|jgi:ATP-dependent DNA helicase RecQ
MDLTALLRERFGFAEFRPAQQQVIDKIMAGQSVLAVMPTGSGKSLCYQLPALALSGLTLVISPLIALMKDQVDQLSQLGLPATVINSTVSREQQRSRLQQAIAGKIKLLYIAPERFQNDEFRAGLNRVKVSLLAIDEAHCISLWGHDFRPDYLRLQSVVRELKSPAVLALTATATPAVRRDIVAQLGIEDAAHVVSGFDRPNLYLEVREVATTAEKIRSIVELARWAPLGIVYGGTRKNVEEIHGSLRRAGVETAAYHAGLALPERRTVQDRFMKSSECVIVATNAFGMGIDRSQVRFVVHADIPDSVEAYYQEIGRAGRDGDPARCLLLFNYADKWIPEFFIDSSHPPADILKYVFGKVCRPGDREIVGEEWRKLSSTKDHRFHASLGLLQRFGYIERIQTQDGRGIRVLKPNDPGLQGINFQDLEARRDFEYKKFGVMLNYASRFRKHCYRSFILSYFGEWSRNRECGNCSRCAPHKYPRGVKSGVSARASSIPPPGQSTESSTIVALKILSCVLRVHEKLGRDKVAKILSGSEDSSVEPYRALSTYGLLSDYSIKSVTGMIDYLIGEEYIAQLDGFRPAIYVTPKGQVFLKERPQIAIPGVSHPA